MNINHNAAESRKKITEFRIIIAINIWPIMNEIDKQELVCYTCISSCN